jgi:hypothetical protein
VTSLQDLELTALQDMWDAVDEATWIVVVNILMLIVLMEMFDT